ncbi:MAG TPA: hypothetical protein VLB84_06475, partial [Bacteroidia bacterium]|nr:hypothetical protein [Bacteroidia bacterium]
RVRKLARSAHIVRTGELEIDLTAWKVNYAGAYLPLSSPYFLVILRKIKNKQGIMVHIFNTRLCKWLR